MRLEMGVLPHLQSLALIPRSFDFYYDESREDINLKWQAETLVGLLGICPRLQDARLTGEGRWAYAGAANEWRYCPHLAGKDEVQFIPTFLT